MKGILKIGMLMMTLVLFTATEGLSQKFGHLNSGLLLSMMPESKTAETELQTFREQQEKLLQDRVTAFQAKIADLQKRFPDLPPVQAKAEQEKLAAEEQELYAARTKGEEAVSKKREELLKPIYAKADVAVQAVGKENGYTMVFDSGAFNIVLFAEDATDILPLVKAKLGL